MESNATNEGLGPADAQSGTATEGRSSETTNASSGSSIDSSHPEQELQRLRNEAKEWRLKCRALEQEIEGTAAMIDKLRGSLLSDRVASAIQRHGEGVDKPEAMSLLSTLALQKAQVTWADDGVSMVGDLDAVVRGILEPLGKLKAAETGPSAAQSTATATQAPASDGVPPVVAGTEPTAANPVVFGHVAQRANATAPVSQAGNPGDEAWLAAVMAKHGLLTG